MKPNEFAISTVLCIIIIIMSIRITDSLAQNGQYCGNLTINSRNSGRYLSIHNNSVLADSEDKYQLYSVNLENSIKFFLYDMKTDRFICLNKLKNVYKQKLVAKRMPDDRQCLFEEKVFDFSTPYIQYVLPMYNFTLRFDKKGSPYTPKRMRHKHISKQDNMLSAFLPRKEVQDSYQCDRLKNTFCTKMRNRKRITKLPKQIRTFCKLNCKRKTA